MSLTQISKGFFLNKSKPPAIMFKVQHGKMDFLLLIYIDSSTYPMSTHRGLHIAYILYLDISFSMFSILFDYTLDPGKTYKHIFKHIRSVKHMILYIFLKTPFETTNDCIMKLLEGRDHIFWMLNVKCFRNALK